MLTVIPIFFKLKQSTDPFFVAYLTEDLLEYYGSIFDLPYSTI